MPSPLQKLSWRIAGKSDVGLVRKSNEDAFFCDAARNGYFAVADGVGGLEFGEKASAAAIEGVRKFLDARSVPVAERPDFPDLFRRLDAEIAELGARLASSGFGIATTLDVAADGGNGVAHFAHLGDSGIFLFRDGALSCLSEDHTLAADELARGNADFPASYNNTLTRALGIGICCVPQVFSLVLGAGDRILFATDGITRSLPLRKIEELVGDPAGTPESVAAALIDAANAAGGHDNSTAVLAFV